MAEILRQNFCVVCQSILRRSFSDSATQIKGREEPGCTAYSTASEALGKQKQQMVLHPEEHHQGGSILNNVKEKEESDIQRNVKIQNHGDGAERCFLGSSLYYGGPDELPDVLKERKIEMEVKKLEEAMDPLNLEFTTRGNWWEGSLYY